MKLTIQLGMLLCGLWSGNAAMAAQLDLAAAKNLIDSGHAAQAYFLLAPFEFELAGNQDFDNLLGIAALDGGQADKATLAFERVLAVNPDSAGARLDMARAYFALGDHARARQELMIVSELSPPPAARLVIEKYRAAIDAQQQKKRTVVSAYLEGSVGHDDNITSVVDSFTSAILATYNLAGFQPTGSAIRRESAILAGTAGIELNHQLDERLSLYAGADLRYRDVLDADNYSSQQLDVRGGASYSRDADMVRAGLTFQQFDQRTDLPTADRNSFGLNAEWRHTFGASDQGSLFAAATRQRFPDIASNDIDSVMIGGGWLHLFNGTLKPLIYASLYTGQDDAQNMFLLSNGAHTNNSRRFFGTRLYGQLSANENLDWFASIGLLRRDDRSMNARTPPGSPVPYGDDSMTDYTLGLSWRPHKDWTVRPQLTYSANHSNVAISEYTRTEASVTVRYDFH